MENIKQTLIIKNIVENDGIYKYYFANALGESLEYYDNIGILLTIKYNDIIYSNVCYLDSDVDDASNNVYKINIINDCEFSNILINNYDINSFVESELIRQ